MGGWTIKQHQRNRGIRTREIQLSTARGTRVESYSKGMAYALDLDTTWIYCGSRWKHSPCGSSRMCYLAYCKLQPNWE